MKKIILIIALVLVLGLAGFVAYTVLTRDQNAYDLATEAGYEGTMDEWLESIVGDSDKTAFELYQEAVGYDGIELMWKIDLYKNALTTYTVTFDADGGALAEGVATDEISLAGCYLTLPTPTKEGYIFKGWRIGDVLYAPETSAAPILGDVTAKAEWEIKIFSVQFVDQNDEILKTEDVPYGGAATAPEAPAVEYYTFSVWDADFSVITADMTVKAVYVPLLYTVTLDADGGELPEGFDTTMYPQSGSQFELPVPTKYGYAFVGWTRVEVQEDGTEVEVDGNAVLASPITITGDITLKAVWVQNLFTVTFLGINGNVLKTEIVERGLMATAPDVPVVERFRFQNWDVDFTVITEDLTVTAVYLPTYIISYNTGDGSAVADTEFCSNEIPVAPADPTKRFYSFEGWFLDKEYTIPYDFSALLVQDITLYAYFIADYYPISTAEELIAIGDDNEGKYYLANDITLSGTQWIPLKGFKGVFDGNGYKITDFTISAESDAGFFVSNSGTIQNLTLADFTLYVSTQNTNTNFTAGALVGTNDGIIDNCHIRDAVLTYYYYRQVKSGTVMAYTGGLVGVNSGFVSDSSVTETIINGTVEAYAYCAGASGSGSQYDRHTSSLYQTLYIGGAIGDNRGEMGGVVSNVIVAGSAITRGYSGYHSSYFGGSSGYDTMYAHANLSVGGCAALNSGIISYSESNIEVVCSASESKPTQGDTYPRIYFGGFVQENTGTIDKCQATATMKADYTFWEISAGGFVSVNKNQITNCHANATIETIDTRTNTPKNNSIGGFVALNQGTITFCYATYDIDTQTLGTIGGFVGRNEKSATIMKCIADGNITYTGEPLGVGSFIGVKDDGSTLFKNHYNAENKILQGEEDVTVADSNATATDLTTLQSYAFLVDTLGYNPEVWEVVDGQYPTLKKGE